LLDWAQPTALATTLLLSKNVLANTNDGLIL